MRYIFLPPWPAFAAILVGIVLAFALPTPWSEWSFFLLAVVWALWVYAVVVWARALLRAFRSRGQRAP